MVMPPSLCPLSPFTLLQDFPASPAPEATGPSPSPWPSGHSGIMPGPCLSCAPSDFQDLLIYPLKALPNCSLPLPSTPYLEEGSRPSQGLPEMPTPLGQDLASGCFPDKHVSERTQWDLNQAWGCGKWS